MDDAVVNSPEPSATDLSAPGPTELKGLSSTEEKEKPTFDLTLSSNRAVDGSIVLLTFHPLKEIDSASLRVKFDGVEYPLYQSAPETKNYESLVVMPFNSKPRMSKIELSWKEGMKSRTASIPMEVIDGNYRAEKLTVQAEKIDPPKKVLKRILAEVKEIGKVYRNSEAKKYWNGPFALPIDSEITSPFGNKRVYNGKMKSFHQGLDLRARTPLPIKAPEAGKVALAKDLYFTGWTVIIDHGYDLFTIYGHMSKLEVKKGDLVTKGTRLGLSGATGRASGPHLHWGAVLMRQKFNPQDLTRVLR